ncbi:hypothetical protein L228DRAFT_246164 [Xylona heveae TC161]|uniref:DASH complex subunit ASK1 n=1 Tax=Xylona heveae (strain CBS 132557 / TC161) TaxID=1328760 RepID=A0A165HEN2_XYLHT|nr:hypothetical protein L228DRAFT_246164 [Xylona heveae TC161]KZF23395.1 hypothetical protein L228DRAFT_246164 [Xylona heveae TC161]
MSRQSIIPPRNLTLTEELEKLEQSITLTLQEIDHNFSRAHHIVTASILPIVEQYAEHSKSVWESSKFWKQFFEASANVSLSGYEEATVDETATTGQEDTTATTEPSGYDDTAHAHDESIHEQDRYEAYQPTGHQEEHTLLSSPSLTGSTPRATSKTRADRPPASFAEYSSPYEALKREIHGESSDLPSTPGKQTFPQALFQSPGSSPLPLDPRSGHKQHNHHQHQQHQQQRSNADPLLHRVLDKNYRIQATPHSQQRRPRSATTPGTATRHYPPPAAQPRWRDDSSPMSSPPIAAPELHSEIFSSPAMQRSARRTPGVSVQTPLSVRKTARPVSGGGGGGGDPSGRMDIETPQTQRYNNTTTNKRDVTRGLWDSDSSDDDIDLGFSPPKTMQFHVPQNKLLQTPAREASKRIVEDLLLTAGGNITDDLEGDEGEDSPSVVRRNMDLDDSF